jgi:hypothetical protein
MLVFWVDTLLPNDIDQLSRWDRRRERPSLQPRHVGNSAPDHQRLRNRRSVIPCHSFLFVCEGIADELEFAEGRAKE